MHKFPIQWNYEVLAMSPLLLCPMHMHLPSMHKIASTFVMLQRYSNCPLASAINPKPHHCFSSMNARNWALHYSIIANIAFGLKIAWIPESIHLSLTCLLSQGPQLTTQTCKDKPSRGRPCVFDNKLLSPPRRIPVGCASPRQAHRLLADRDQFVISSLSVHQ